MTRERAIVNIKALDVICGQKPFYDDEFKEALNMAINALEQEPCEDCISRENLLEQVYIWGGDTETLIEYIKGMPSVTPQPKTGHWIDDEFGSKCSCCGIHTHLDKFDRPMKFKYCSMCGARMIEPQESEDKE